MSGPNVPGGDLYTNAEARLRFEAYRCVQAHHRSCFSANVQSTLSVRGVCHSSRLQAAAVAFGESLPIPEIVAIGGQSDGKSSLLEAFLGFRFNVR